MFMHGLWKWNWADSHRPLLSISGHNITVGADDINRDVNPIHAHRPAMQGGYVYAYGLKSQLDAPGEYHIDAKAAKLSFLPPEGASSGSYSVSRLYSAVVARGASDITFEGLEIRYARGPGVKIDDSKNVVLKSCTVSNHGMMGVNVTGGSGCGVQASEVAGNGDAGVVLSGGDRISLTPSKHFVNNCTVHHNHRWIMMFSPDVLLAGVGQSVTDSEIYGSPHFAVCECNNVASCTHSVRYVRGRHVAALQSRSAPNTRHCLQSTRGTTTRWTTATCTTPADSARTARRSTRAGRGPTVAAVSSTRSSPA